MSTVVRNALVGLLLGTALFLGAACSDDANEGDQSLASVLTALEFLGNAGYHEIDESINEDGEIPGDAATRARRGQTAIHLADWPDDLEEQAEAVEAILAEFITELEKPEPDLAVAGEHATRVHDGVHEFESAAWNHLHDQAGIAHEDDHE
jgi:hypothetical protein